MIFITSLASFVAVLLLYHAFDALHDTRCNTRIKRIHDAFRVGYESGYRQGEIQRHALMTEARNDDQH